MNSLIRTTRFLALMLMITLAAILPVPLILYEKDKKPKFLTEQIDEQDEGEEEGNIAEVF